MRLGYDTKYTRPMMGLEFDEMTWNKSMNRN